MPTCINELHHYGVKGMKWGTHRIKSGTIVQRVTDNKNESEKGRTYVSFKTNIGRSNNY